MPEAMSLTDAIATRLRQLRMEHGGRQEEIAAAARHFGLQWTQATVAAIETGKRRLSLEELTLLPLILQYVFKWLVGFSELVPNDKVIEVTPQLRLKGSTVTEIWSGGYEEGILEEIPLLRAKLEQSWKELDAIDQAICLAWPNTTNGELMLYGERIHYESHGVAEQKAARRLGVRPWMIVVAAHHLWGRGLTEEREARMNKDSDGATSSRTLQAMRGHVTRILLHELESPVEQLSRAEREGVAGEGTSPA
jgi:transcriptional regulator with XRE-family HTH domain